MFNRKIFSDRLAATRKDRGLTQQELASHISVGKSNIALLEAGERSPSVEALVALAKCLNVSVDYLVGRAASSAIKRNAEDNEFMMGEIQPLEVMIDDQGLICLVQDHEVNKPRFVRIHPVQVDLAIECLLEARKEIKEQ